MKPNDDYMAQTIKELIDILKQGKPRIRYIGVARTEEICDAISVAQETGYKVKSERLNDPGDPGGCMSLLESHLFIKTD
jgi:hypothetical protein